MLSIKEIEDLQSQANYLFKQTHLSESQYQDLITILHKLPKNVSESFIRQTEKLLLSELGLTEQVALENDYLPWSVKDMNSYYLLHPNYQPLSKDLAARRKETITGNPISFYDDLQIQRDRTLCQNTKDDLNSHFNKLNLLSQLQASLNPEKKAQDYFINYLFLLLGNYRTTLNASLLAEDNKEKDEPIIYQDAVVIKIDWITKYFAMHFTNIICDFKVEQQAPELKALLLKLDALDEEIYPWISVFLRQKLRANYLDEKTNNLYIESFLNFHKIKQDKSLGERLYNFSGESQKPLFKKFLLEDIETWKGIQANSIDKKILNIKYYLQKTDLSPWVVFNICQDLVPLAKTPLGLSSDYRMVLFLLIERIQKQKEVFNEAFAYLTTLPVADKPSILDLIYLQDSSLEKAIDLALETGFLPPSPSFLYGMWKKEPSRTLEIIDKLATTDPRVLQETLWTIFFNEQYATQHEQFLTAKVHPLINETIFPLFALKRAYAEEASVPNEHLLDLWMQSINSGMLTNTHFFKSEANQKLFAKLEPLSEKLIGLNLTADQIKTIGIALALFRTTQLHLWALDLTGNPLALLTGPSRIEYTKESAWAEDCLYKLMAKIAYPKNNNIDFGNIVRFLGLEFFPISMPQTEPELLVEQVTEDLGHYVAANLSMEFEHQFKLLHVFIQLFLLNQKIDFKNSPPYALGMLLKLPPMCHVIYNLMNLKNYVDVPEWYSKSLSAKIMAVVKSTELQNSLQNAYMRPYFSMLEQFNEEYDEELAVPDFLKKFIAQSSPQAELKANQLTIYFLKHLYLAYSQLNADTDLSGECAKMVQQVAHEEQLYKEAQPIRVLVAAIRKQLNQNYKTTRDNYSGWKSSVGAMFGYNLDECKAQSSHFKTIEKYLTQNDILDLESCTHLIAQIKKTTEDKVYKKSFNNFYHEHLIKLTKELLILKSKIETTLPKQRVSRSEEYKTNTTVFHLPDRSSEFKQCSVAQSPFAFHANNKRPKEETKEPPIATINNALAAFLGGGR